MTLTTVRTFHQNKHMQLVSYGGTNTTGLFFPHTTQFFSKHCSFQEALLHIFSVLCPQILYHKTSALSKPVFIEENTILFIAFTHEG